MNFNSIYPRLLTPKQNLKGINPKLIYPQTGKSFDLPRFISSEMKEARVMNKIAKHNDYIYYSNRIPPKATQEDIIKLTDDNFTYKRAVWINPKDSKPYYLLENFKEQNGNTNIRILNKDGEFVKNASLPTKEIILTDLDIGAKPKKNILGINFSHTDIIEIIARRYNPFAKYRIRQISSDNDMLNIKKEITPKTSCLSMSFGIYHNKPPLTKTGTETKKVMQYNIKKLAPEELSLLEKHKELASKVRVLASSGNDGHRKVGILFLNTGFEGVGGLDKKGFVDINSSSRNSYFTQHYEPYSFDICKTKNGINISSLKGTDLEIDGEFHIAEGKVIDRISGTSFSAPIRAAKIALNEMMKDIL